MSIKTKQALDLKRLSEGQTKRLFDVWQAAKQLLVTKKGELSKNISASTRGAAEFMVSLVEREILMEQTMAESKQESAELAELRRRVEVAEAETRRLAVRVKQLEAENAELRRALRPTAGKPRAYG